MKRFHTGLLAFTAAGFLAFASVACENTTRGAKQDANEAAADARDAKDEAKAEANEEKAEAQDDAARARAEGREAAGDARKAAGDAGAAIDAATETLDVKAALMADSTVDASDINVDTLHETKTVVLKGTVTTQAQKVEAGKIAAREATGYKIDNQLSVKPRS